MDFYSLEGECLHHFSRHQGPEALFLLIQRELSHSIQTLDLSLPEVQETMARSSFSFDMVKSLCDFFQDDWKLEGCLLDDRGYGLHSLILAKDDPQGHEYRLMVNVNPDASLWRLEAVHYHNKGFLFAIEDHHPYEMETVRKLYESFLPVKPEKNDVIEPKKEPNCFEIKKDYSFDLSQTGKYVFFSHMGPSSLFQHAYERLQSFERNGLNFQDPEMIEDLRHRPIFVKQALSQFLASKWRLESVVLNKYLSIEGLLLFNVEEFRFHLFVNTYGKVIYLIDCEIDSGLPVFEEDSVYTQTSRLYETPKYKAKREAYERKHLKPVSAKPVVIEPEALPEIPPKSVAVLPPCSQIVQTEPKKEIPKKIQPENAYADWLDKFKTKKILVIGDTALTPDMVKNVCRDLGFQKDNIILYNDYAKMTNLDFTSLKGKQDKYCGIVLGPTPHSLRGLGNFASLAAMLATDDYPFTAEATRLGDAKDFKITRTSLIEAVSDIIRHEIVTNPTFI